MKTPLSCAELLAATELTDGHVVEGAELVRLFWTIKQRESDLARRERYWASMHEALTSAYQTIDDAKGALDVQLQAKVRERSRELVLALRRAGMEQETSFFAPGTVIGQRARIVKRIGEGAMGSVYSAEDLLTSRPVAIKIVRSVDRRALGYFVAEAEAASAVAHPAIVRTIHIDVTDEGYVFQLMDLVDGVTLARRLRAQALPQAACARVGALLAGALAAAHAHGVIHRDIKPDNVLLSADVPGVHVLDFGVARRLGVDQTLSGAVVGTPLYMSPDQIRAPATVTAAADIYSLGVVLFEALAGRRPFEARGTEALLSAHLDEPPPRLREVAPETAPELAVLVDACLQKDPAQRPGAAAVEESLRAAAVALHAPRGEEIGAEAKSLVDAMDATSCGEG